ncbi:MAG: glycosyltransferase family 4 protein [Pseudomonadota bacterium]
MRILLLTGEFDPFNIGGLGRYVNKIFELISSDPDIQIDVLNIINYIKIHFSSPFKALEKIQTKRSIILHIDGKSDGVVENDKEGADIIASSIQYLLFPYDIVFVQDVHNARVARQLLQKKLVSHIISFVHLSCNYYNPHLQTIYQSKTAFISKKRVCEKILEELSSAYLCPSKHTKKLATSPKLRLSTCHVIPLAANINLAQTSLQQLNKNKWDHLQPLRLISVGRFVEQKAPLYLCDVIKYCRDFGLDFHITLIGTGYMKAEVDVRLQKENLNDYVTIIYRHLNEKEVFAHLSKSHIFISTTLFESFGFSILEAMACECVPICFNNTAIPELINSNEVGFLIENEQPQYMAEKILSLAKTPNLLQKIASNAKCRASHYTWERHVKKLMSLFTATLGSPI